MKNDKDLNILGSDEPIEMVRRKPKRRRKIRRGLFDVIFRW